MFVWRVLWWLISAAFLRKGRRHQRVRPGRPFAVRVVTVQDGDSLVVVPSDSSRSEEFRVRLYAIDAPEWEQPRGREARDYLAKLVWGRLDLVLEPMDTDQYGRLVGVLYYREAGRQRSINRLMVGQGLAWWYRRFGGHGLGLEHAEREAQHRRRGIWSEDRSVAPWDHRQARREASRRGGCTLRLLLAAAVGIAVVFVVFLLERFS